MIELGLLKDPHNFTEPLDVKHFESGVLLSFLHSMMKIRVVEEAIGELVKEGFVKTPCHLAIGQEAIPVGVSYYLNPTDKIFGCHRSHGHLLALGSSLKPMLAEILCRVTGVSKGMGGSMHMVDLSKGFYGSVPIVGATIPIAVGAALAEKMREKNQVAVSYFGDGACEEGVFHESLNFASLHQLPILFVCENNLFSSHLDIELRQPKDAMSRFAFAHNIKYRLIDGNDVCVVADAAAELISNCRSGQGPGFLEVVTYRWRGHVGPNEDIDVGTRRSMTKLHAWKKRDPIARLIQGMGKSGFYTERDYQVDLKKIQDEVKQAVDTVKGDPFPEIEQINKLVYSES